MQSMINCTSPGAYHVDHHDSGVYEQGGSDHEMPKLSGLKHNLINLPNLGGREGDTFASHLVR